jgi:hypothetical protein
MGITDIFRTNGNTQTSPALERELSAERSNVALLQERLSELELAIDSQGWERLGFGGDLEFSRDGLGKIIRQARLMQLKNPLIRRGTNLRSYYTWGQGPEVSARDQRVQDVVERFYHHDKNQAELFSQQARFELDVELQNTGNVFAVMIPQRRNAEVQVRTIPVDEIIDIICDPDDRRTVWYYQRSWTRRMSSGGSTETKRALYPDIDYQPRTRPDTVNGMEVRWETPVVHLRSGGQRNMRFGVPETYAALDWATAHKGFLEDWSTLVRSLSRFAWKMTTQGSVSAAHDALNTTYYDSGNAVETNPSPVAGSVFVGDPGVDMTPIPKTGATTAAGDNRELRLMVASALDLPDTFLSGDVDVGNLATARSLDRPTEMMVRSRQGVWESFYRRLFQYAVEWAVINRAGVPGGVQVVDGQQVVTVSVDEPDIDIEWPSVLEHSQQEQIEALVNAATLGGSMDAGTIPREVLIRRLLTILDVDNVDELVTDMLNHQDTEAQESLAEAVTALRRSLERVA